MTKTAFPPTVSAKNATASLLEFSGEFGGRNVTEIMGRRAYDGSDGFLTVLSPNGGSDVVQCGDDVTRVLREDDDNVTGYLDVDLDVDSPADVSTDVAASDDFIADISANTTASPTVAANVINEKLKKMLVAAQMGSIHTGLFVGNIPLHAYPDTTDKIAQAFNNSTRKMLSYVAPTVQNGEVIVRLALDIICTGSKQWRTTAVGYFLGKRLYFHHMREFALSICPDLTEFRSIISMEDVIEGEPWLFQGQPIQLPMELWTEEGLSIVASGVSKPLYPDAIMRACMRLNFARVCVMLDVTSKLSKHIIIMTPDEDGGESPCKIDVEYEWLPPMCTSCMTLKHAGKECALNKVAKPIKTPFAIYVPKVRAPRAQTVSKNDKETAPNRDKELMMIYNLFDDLQLIDDAEDKRELWGSLETLALQYADISWLVGGDFNTIRDMSSIDVFRMPSATITHAGGMVYLPQQEHGILQPIEKA
ncbi:UNVERIFIED_CONTAM: hypothetical protein Sindi_0374300 [Sesamum indicum]